MYRFVTTAALYPMLCAWICVRFHIDIAHHFCQSPSIQQEAKVDNMLRFTVLFDCLLFCLSCIH